MHIAEQLNSLGHFAGFNHYDSHEFQYQNVSSRISSNAYTMQKPAQGIFLKRITHESRKASQKFKSFKSYVSEQIKSIKALQRMSEFLHICLNFIKEKLNIQPSASSVSATENPTHLHIDTALPAANHAAENSAKFQSEMPVKPDLYSLAQGRMTLGFYNKDQANALAGQSFDMFADKGAYFNDAESSLGRVRDAQYEKQDLVLNCLTRPKSLHHAVLDQFNKMNENKIQADSMSQDDIARLNAWTKQEHLPVTVSANMSEALAVLDDKTKELGFGHKAHLESVSLMGRSSIKSDQEFGILSSIVNSLDDYNTLIQHTFGDYIPALRAYEDPESQEQPFKNASDLELVQSIFKFEKRNQPILFEVRQNKNGTLNWNSFKSSPVYTKDLSQFSVQKLGDPKKGVGFYQDTNTGKTYVDLVRCVPLMYHLCFLNPNSENLKQAEDTGILTIGRGVRSNLSRAFQETYTSETKPPFVLTFHAGKQHYSNCNTLFKALAYAETNASIDKWQVKEHKTPFDNAVLNLYQQKLEQYKPAYDVIKSELAQHHVIKVNGNGRSVEDFIDRACAVDDFKGIELAVITRKGPGPSLQSLVQKLSAR